ncbi:MAG: NAD-dependent dehydratase, partial [Anaerolineae bacterium]|nr:NAD-dependent dehydratase [Anaerolineae bacterium]
MRILIIGGTRFVGPPVVQRLHDQGHTLWLFHRSPAQIELPTTVKHILGDRYELADHRDTFRRIKPDVVLDMIPLAQADAQAVVDVFKEIAGRVVTVSNQDVYRAYGRVNGLEPGEPDDIPLTEDAPLRGRLFPYRGETPRTSDDPRRWMDDYDKILVEQVVMENGVIPGTVLRLPLIYGPGDYQHRLFVHLKRMDDDRPAIIMSEQLARWRWTRDYVENTAAAIALATTDDRAAGRIYNVGEMPALTMAQWIHEIGQIAKWRGKVVTAPDYQLPEDMQSQAGLEQHLVIDSTRIRQELGYREVVSRVEGLVYTVSWERANPPEHIDVNQFDYANEDLILARLNR